MDGLNLAERALAWEADWHPSFVGKAIVNEDLTFRAVNPQFCEIAGVTPAELLGNTFTDITPQPSRDLDLQNAKLVMQGKIEGYMMDKVYEFPDGRKVSITLLVNGVYHPTTNAFMFFVSSIMERKRITSSVPLDQQPRGLFGDKIKGRVFWGVAATLGAILAAALEKLAKGL